FAIGQPGVGNSDGSNTGSYDEIRISSGLVRSADWIATEYNNQGSGSPFYRVYTEASASSVLSSTATGNWSAPTTWTNSQVPTPCNAVNVVFGTTVTFDTSGMSSTSTISGTLKFSRVANSTWTVVRGTVTVPSGGTIDMGTSGSPIPNGVNAKLIL